METGQNQRIWPSVSSLVERGQNQSCGAQVYFVEVTDLNQNPGALNLVSSAEEKGLNQRLSDCHLGRRKSPTCDSDVFEVTNSYEIFYGWVKSLEIEE